ncbi:MAG: T9SS type A sorting domain-containing protein [Candidatus Cloacimonetes bacterium]|nr:T9SS type A sorting domain-containing protein [Candidatus Cloacimonadota bacterium]MCF7814143.1 T9SS type A sorting domain-containing protein [Candidatus Cloacimonadota bacterium]MCF7868758.1 T9SS type A sorting domain-containing protein [Candidatus Cloacimonadota bacterium]MCF7884142.1 T9SS type A sorting domain-containing protein [Candidatus Cloacimonadota bacterium]
MAVFKSSDAGNHWESANEGIAVLWINDIAVDPTNSENIIVGFEAENSGGCYMSYDGGDSWEIVETLPATRYSAVAFDINGNVLACSEGPTTVGQEGIYRSTDGGATWTATGPNLGPNFETQLWDIEVSQTDPDLYFISGNHFGNGGWAATVYRTYDGTATDWEEVYIGPDNYEIRSIDLANSNEQFVYAGYTTFNVTGSLIRSTDQGNNWTDINNGVPQDCCRTYAVAVDPTNPLKVYAGCGVYSSGFHILKTEDGGDQWDTVYTTSSDITSIIIDPDNPDHLYAAARTNGVIMSNDAGIGWQDASDGLAVGSELSRFSNPFEEDGETKFYLGTYNRSAFKNTMEISSQLNPPNNVVIELVNFNDVYLSWEQPDLTSATLLGYNIYRDGTIIFYVDDANVLEYLVEGHDAGVYQYYLTALYDEGVSSPVGNADITVILPAPTNVTATVNWPNILIQWDAPTESRSLESYNVYQDDVLVANVTSTFYLHLNVPAGTWIYNVAAVFTGGWEGEWSEDAGVVGNEPNLLPLTTNLKSNYPNPFNPETEISFSVSQTSSFVTIKVFNMKGQKIKTLINEILPAGNHSVIWNGTDDENKNCSSGVYFYKMKSGDYQQTRKMILSK